MSIDGDLQRARTLACAADEFAARDLLLSLMPRIEAQDRDDLLLEVFGQLGDIYLTRGAIEGAQECVRRIDDCLAIYAAIRDGKAPHLVAQVTMPDADIDVMMRRYSCRATYLHTAIHAARGDHDGARTTLAVLVEQAGTAEDADLVTSARIACATALCDDDLHARSVSLWRDVLAAIDSLEANGQAADHLRVTGWLGYARFCVETGRLDEAEPVLQRAGARADAHGWELLSARTQLERAAVSWLRRDHLTTEQLVTAAYPTITRHARAHDVSRCWLYFGLTRMAAGAFKAADECWEHAERHSRELGNPLHIHRILLQRSWIDVFRGRYADATERIAQARDMLDSSPRSTWLQYARIDFHLGSIWRADALAGAGFDGAGDPSESWEQTEARQAAALGVFRAQPGTREYVTAMAKFEQAAELKVPAALAVDAVRYTIADADARQRWAATVSAPMLAGAFAVAYEGDNAQLLTELIEYHGARGTFSIETSDDGPDWDVATTPTPADGTDHDSIAAAGEAPTGGGSFIRLGPLPPLLMCPDGEPILARYRELAHQRYGRDITAHEPAWATFP